MCRSGIGAVALATALLGATAFVRPASAQPAAVSVAPAVAVTAGPVRDERISAEALADLEAERLLLFGGTDFWRAGGFLHGGFAWAPDGLARDGPIFKLLAGTGTYQYRVGRRTINAAQGLLTVTPGWVFRRDRFVAVVHGGVDLQYHWTLPYDPTNALLGASVGMRLGVETWWEPIDNTMVKAHATWSSTGHGWGAGAAAGYRMLETWYGGLFVGPELQAFGDTNYRQIRAGLHGTALQYGPYQWSGGIGWVTDSDHRSGLYVRLGVLTKM